MPEEVEQYVQRWLREKDSMDIVQPLYQLNNIIQN
uniref:Uncharacterized protein n=1 Tax=Bracon brevicornis TaxID=1563983 RepID=A0A6V7M136_9HYME